MEKLDTLCTHLNFQYQLLSAIDHFKDNEDIEDYAKRCFLRFFFILLDDILKTAPQLKNILFKLGEIDKSQREDIGKAITNLNGSYNTSYDLIRDKIGAHQQPIPIIEAISWWNEIEYSTITILFDDAMKIQSSFSKVGVPFEPTKDFKPLQIPSDSPIKKKEINRISTDRFALTTDNTISLISRCSLQDKGQLITSLIRFFEINREIASITDDPDSIYKWYVFNISWLLNIVDLVSLIENLFNDNEYDQSLLTYWKSEQIKGYDKLQKVNLNRDINFENQLREIRNKLGAHMDATMNLLEAWKSFESIPLVKIDKYIYWLITQFRDACREDVQTKMFLMHNQSIEDEAIVDYRYQPNNQFDDR